MLGSIRATVGNEVTAYAFNARNRWGETRAMGSVYDLARKLNGAGQGTRWDHGNAGDDDDDDSWICSEGEVWTRASCANKNTIDRADDELDLLQHKTELA